MKSISACIPHSEFFASPCLNHPHRFLPRIQNETAICTRSSHQRVFEARYQVVQHPCSPSESDISLSILCSYLACPSRRHHSSIPTWFVKFTCSRYVPLKYKFPMQLSDIFANLAITSYCLSGSHPLPPSLPNLRDRIVYHERHSASTRSILKSLPTKPQRDSEEYYQSSESSDGEEDIELVAGKVDGSAIGFEELSLHVMMVRLTRRLP